MKFAVSIIRPPNFLHVEAVREVAETVYYGLLELGHDAILTHETNLPDRQHITLAPGFLTLHETELAPNSILYNFEQIYLGSPWLQPILLDHLLQYPVWDYSQANIEQLQQIGIPQVQHVPLGYVPQLTRISAAPEEDIDVLFYGSINDRRYQVLEALRQRGVNVQNVFGVYGQERDALIARAKIVLNLHFYPSNVFEAVRVTYLLANQRFVISERGCDPSEEAAFASGLVFADYKHLVETCMDFLARPADRQQIAEKGLELMTQRSEADYLRAAIATLDTVNQPRAEFVYRRDLFRKQRAAACLAQGDWEHAIAMYEQSLEVDPDCAQSYWNLGLALLLSGDEVAAQLTWFSGLTQEDAEPSKVRSLELQKALQAAAEWQRSQQNETAAAQIDRQLAELFPPSHDPSFHQS